MDIFAERLRRVRRAKDLTQQDLAIRAGVHYTTISRIESGKMTQCSLEIGRDLAKGLGVSLDYLVGLTDEACSSSKREPAVVV